MIGENRWVNDGPGKSREIETRDYHQRYWIAAYHNYYPSGFLSDVSYTCDTIDEVKQVIEKIKGEYIDFIEVFDVEKREIIEIKP